MKILQVSSLLTRSKKLNRLKNQLTALLGALKEGQTQGKLLPSRLEAERESWGLSLTNQRFMS